MRGTVLHATLGHDEVPEDPEEYYDHQLVGLAVVDLDGTALGEVKAVVHGSAQDLLTVRTPDGRDALVPFVDGARPRGRPRPRAGSSSPTAPAWSRPSPTRTDRTRAAAR